MSEALSAVQQRWSGFLDKIAQRACEVLDEARQQCMDLFHQHGEEPTAVINALPAIRQRLLDLSRRIDDSWSQQVSAAFETAGSKQADDIAAQEQGRALRDSIEEWFDEFEVRVRADMSRMMWARLAANLPEQLLCTQCGAPVPAPDSFVAANVPCPSCQALVTYEPGEARIIEAFIIPSLAHEEMWEKVAKADVLYRPARLQRHPSFQLELGNWRRRYEERLPA